MTENALAALNLGARRTTVVWRRARKADGLATRMQRATEAMANDMVNLGRRERKRKEKYGGELTDDKKCTLSNDVALPEADCNSNG